MGHSGDGVTCVGNDILILFHLSEIFVFKVSFDFSYRFVLIYSDKQTSTNATPLDYHRSICTWRTFVIRTQTAPTPKDLTNVAVRRVFMEADENVGVPLFYDNYGISVLAIT